MMDLNEFAEYVRDNIEDYLIARDVERIDINHMEKTNGVMRTGLVVLCTGESVSPNVYLEGFHEQYEKGADMEDILQQISDAYTEARERMLREGYADVAAGINASGLFLKAVNYEKNRGRLSDIVHERYMDLALEVRYLFNADENGIASAPLSYGMLENLGMSRTEAFKRAKENTPELFQVQFDTLFNILKSKGMIDADMRDMEEVMPPVYVLTSSNSMNGAAYIAYEDVIAALLQKHDIRENVYILPSSIHELLLIPAREGMDVTLLQLMVQEVNRDEVGPEEYLSNNVYWYDAREKEISQITDVHQEQSREKER